MSKSKKQAIEYMTKHETVGEGIILNAAIASALGAAGRKRGAGIAGQLFSFAKAERYTDPEAWDQYQEKLRDWYASTGKQYLQALLPPGVDMPFKNDTHGKPTNELKVPNNFYQCANNIKQALKRNLNLQNFESYAKLKEALDSTRKEESEERAARNATGTERVQHDINAICANIVKHSAQIEDEQCINTIKEMLVTVAGKAELFANEAIEARQEREDQDKGGEKLAQLPKPSESENQPGQADEQSPPAQAAG